MEKNLFYTILKSENKLYTLFKIELSETLTIITTPHPELKNIHTTLHKPNKEKGFENSVFHIRDTSDSSSKTLLRSISIPNEEIQDLGIMMVDISTEIKNLNLFKKQSFNDSVTLDTLFFGKHMTFYLFQGKPKNIKKEIEKLIHTKKAKVIIPHKNGSAIVGPEHPVYCEVWIFESTINTTVGFLILGHNILNENTEKTKNNQHSETKYKYTLFGSGKRKSGEI